MALINNSSIADFLKSLRTAAKRKDRKVDLPSGTAWITTREQLDEAARQPGMILQFLGFEEDGAEEPTSYWVFEAALSGSGDRKRLAIEE